MPVPCLVRGSYELPSDDRRIDGQRGQTRPREGNRRPRATDKLPRADDQTGPHSSAPANLEENR
ncbi:hypothetical protein ACLI4R_02860 [Natrialbaceae archaeon A-chndr2]